MGTPPPETLLLVVCVPLCSLPPLAASQVCQFTTLCVCPDLQVSLIGVIQAFIRSSLVEFQGFTLEALLFGIFSLYNCIVVHFFSVLSVFNMVASPLCPNTRQIQRNPLKCRSFCVTPHDTPLGESCCLGTFAISVRPSGLPQTSCFHVCVRTCFSAARVCSVQNLSLP